MKIFSSCSDSIDQCMRSKRFGISHLTSEIPTSKLHIHSCHEIYYSISGGRYFFIADHDYDIQAGDVFFIPCNENHHIVHFDHPFHERINIAVHPDFLSCYSTQETSLGKCFELCSNGLHRIRLNAEEQKRFEYLVLRIGNAEGFGTDIRENAWMLELLVMLNGKFLEQNQMETQPADAKVLNSMVIDLMSYINNHMQEDLSVKNLAKQFFVSESYLCRTFKAQTGLTVNNYVKARRISIAKSLLDSGVNAGDCSLQAGFSNYTTFYKAFTEIVGTSPQNYLKFK